MCLTLCLETPNKYWRRGPTVHLDDPIRMRVTLCCPILCQCECSGNAPLRWEQMFPCFEKASLTVPPCSMHQLCIRMNAFNAKLESGWDWAHRHSQIYLQIQ